MKSSSTVVFDSAALRRAASGIDLLLSRVASFEQAAGQAAGSLAGSHPWGLLGEVYLREGCTSMMNGFGEHLRHMNDALTGARDRIARSADTYSAAGEYCLDVLNSVREDQAAASGALRRLNPASRFYNEHRILNGAMIALPYPLGSLGSSTLDGVRFIGDLTSGDPYNISTDLANLGADATQALFEIPQALIWISRNPLDYLVQTGITFLLNAFYWTKYLADCVTGTPSPPARPPTTTTASPKAAINSPRTSPPPSTPASPMETGTERRRTPRVTGSRCCGTESTTPGATPTRSPPCSSSPARSWEPSKESSKEPSPASSSGR
ncbi:hypothetical protein [Actinoallomurus iriomotensis]|uniref:Uncharacterized protein n=1 Tax=Actinoallomurus iriomotensis TaxID=478107 RepID=A0A9W6S9T6_9ACTN|nr:hypothetical protein [Actinoallomurus iriomotensis]GLY89989.1 hypothetical protein Airi02_079180 [Actinoallomurus iriomotensis]